MIKGDKFLLNQYEYKTLSYIPEEIELDKLGSEGWELCSILNLNPGINKILYYFKRKRGELMTITECQNDNYDN